MGCLSVALNIYLCDITGENDVLPRYFAQIAHNAFETVELVAKKDFAAILWLFYWLNFHKLITLDSIKTLEFYQHFWCWCWCCHCVFETVTVFATITAFATVTAYIDGDSISVDRNKERQKWSLCENQYSVYYMKSNSESTKYSL